MRANRLFIAAAMCGAVASCASQTSQPTNGLFADAEQSIDDGAYDTGYQTSLDAAEVEVDFEGDIASASAWDVSEPLSVGQFALTYLRRHSNVYMQSLAEDYAHGTDKIEWLVGSEWKTTATEPRLASLRPTHYRLRGISAIVLHPGSRTALATKSWTAVVPRSPLSLFDDVGTACGTPDGHIDVSSDVYWYVWTPEKHGCSAQTTNLTVKVSRVLSAGHTTYPEFDRLLADHEIDALMMYGQIDDGPLKSSDEGFQDAHAFEAELVAAGFTKSASAPLGDRYTRTRMGIKSVVDIYPPNVFGGLDDTAHIANFDRGVSTHEIVGWNGHSMLGASDFWARPEIYSGANAHEYQVFIYDGCLGYEYYVNPILEGKGGWDNVDIVANAVESVGNSTGIPLAMILAGAERGGRGTSWQTIMSRMNASAQADGSLYGAHGVRDNRFHPAATH